MRVAILLAAGASRRMGRAKLTLELGGLTLVERSLRNLLDAGVELVRLVVAPGFDASFAAREIENGRVAIVHNSDRSGGLSSSMRAGLRDLPADCQTILVGLADKPLVTTATIRGLLDGFDGAEAKAAYPTFRGEQGHPVVFDASLLDELRGVEADRGAKSLLMRYREDALVIEVDDIGVCFDIDTPEDFTAAQEIVERRDYGASH